MTAIRHTFKIEVEYRQRLQTLDEALGVIVENHALIQQAFRIEYRLQFLHYLIGRLAPLIFHKRCHIATCTMLSLQRAVILFNDQLSHITHHLSIASHLVLVSKTLVQNEVIVTLESMSINTSIIVAMVSNQFLKFYSSFRQRLDGESHILNETRGANRTRTTHTWEDTRADSPVLTIYLRIFRKLSWDIEFELS